MADRQKVFISYAWTDDVYQNRVVQLAERLMGDGIDVLLDVWDLPDGGDIYKYMEQSVNDPSVTKVLLLCNTTYKDKATHRKGGVGQETTIITPELFKDSSTKPKFLPIIFEPTADKDSMLPAQLASRKYIDLSDEILFEEKYQGLKRTILGVPLLIKPNLGPLPDLTSENSDRNDLSDLVGIRNRARSITDFNQKGKILAWYYLYRETFFNALDKFKVLENFPDRDPEFSRSKAILLQIQQMLPLRNEYCNLLTIVFENGFEPVIDFPEFFENIWNRYISEETSKGINFLKDPFSIFLRELIISTVAFCLRFKTYSIITSIVSHTYYLKIYGKSSAHTEGKQISHFNINEQSIQLYLRHEAIDIRKEGKYQISYVADLLLEREFLPVLSKSSILISDFYLYWLSSLSDPSSFPWFPITYIYANPIGDLHLNKFESTSFCQSMLPMFGVESLKDLKTLFLKHKDFREVGYSSYPHGLASGILKGHIKVEDVASKP